jgi:CubicO group peptidase (beta-lactamase class C family)
MKNVITVAWFLLTHVSLTYSQPSGSLPASAIERIERAISSEMARQNIPGMSAAIVTDHHLRWSNGFGFSDLENFVPAKASTVYRLGSISKPITAVAVLQLVEQGKLDLDAPVQRYVPSFPQKPWLLTPRHLLNHTGGVRHYRGDEINITKQYQSLTEGLTIFQSDSLLFQPGTRYSYSTFGYNLLGVVVEGASGKAFVDYTREQIFTPAGMIHARDDNVQDIIYNRAYGYRKTPTGELKNSDLANTSYKIPGGGFVSTVEDLAKFAIAVQTNKLLKAETVQRMFTPQRLTNGQIVRTNPNNPSVSYGLGWFMNERGGEKEVYHTGGQQRVSTLLYMLPERKFAVVLMSNLEGARLLNLAREIADIVLKGM